MGSELQQDPSANTQYEYIERIAEPHHRNTNANAYSDTHENDANADTHEDHNVGTATAEHSAATERHSEHPHEGRTAGWRSAPRIDRNARFRRGLAAT